MKVETIPPSTPTSHPLQATIDAVLSCPPGGAVRISDIPAEYLAATRLHQALEEATHLALRVERGDRARTPESYVVHVLGKGVASDWTGYEGSEAERLDKIAAAKT